VGDTVSYEGNFKGGGRFGAVMKYVTDGTVSSQRDPLGYDQVVCRDYTHFTAYVTGYAFEEPTEPVVLPYEQLYQRHLALYAPIYERVKLEFGYSTLKSTDEMILEASYDTPDPAIYELMFHYARYLFISCAADCAYPPNLQGIWNGDYEPAWNCDFHNDENIQICMWPGLPMQMPETVRTYMNYYFGCMDVYRHNAKKYFNAEGIAVPTAQTVDGKGPYEGYWNNCPGMAGWIGQLFFDYWLYTRDNELLEKQIVPYLEEVAKFYMSYCTVIDGKCQFIPSLSPENEPKIHISAGQQTQDNGPSIICVNSTFDLAIAKEVLRNLIRAYEELGKDASEYEKWLAMMPDYKINQDGAIKEWLNDELEDNYEHRHMSHIYPFFPGCEINEYNNKPMFEAIRVAIQKRMTEGLTAQTGWSLTHMAHIFARLGMAEEALSCLKILTRTVVLNNLLTLHNDYRTQGNTLYWDFDFPFQIDALLGVPSVIAEMFAYSSDGYIKITPAVPGLFANARISGIALKDNMTLDIIMENGVLKSAVLTAKKQTPVKLDINGQIRDMLLYEGRNELV